MKKIIVSLVFFVTGISANATKSTILAITLVLSAFSISAQAALNSYTSDGKELVYSSVSDATWTKDGNLLGTLFATQDFNTLVNAIIATSPTISNTPNFLSPTGTYTLSASDFSSNGQTSWWGALGYVNYLNSISYGGINNWYLPTVSNTTYGYNADTNGTAKGDELVELYYKELGGTPVPNTAKFTNVQTYLYWSGTEYSPFPNVAWYFNTGIGYQKYYSGKDEQYFAWAVSPGQVAAVPEPEFAAMLLLGLGLVGFASRRQTKTA